MVIGSQYCMERRVYRVFYVKSQSAIKIEYLYFCFISILILLNVSRENKSSTWGFYCIPNSIKGDSVLTLLQCWDMDLFT